MFSIIRRRFTYANVALTVALVFAMSGGAYAAKRYVITSTKQISPSVLKAIAGKPGPSGKEGTAGKNGVNGNAGAQGPQGLEGKPGAKGEAGQVGQKGETGATGATGPTGPQGPIGPKGEPWTPNNTLPSGTTETGAWSASGVPIKFFTVEILYVPISFTIPLEQDPAGVHVIEEGQETTECPGGSAKPKALAGNLCIFLNSKINVASIQSSNPGDGESEESGTTGDVLVLKPEKAGEGMLARGTWAVTAPASS